DRTDRRAPEVRRPRSARCADGHLRHALQRPALCLPGDAAQVAALPLGRVRDDRPFGRQRKAASAGLFHCL
ncbi:MAG: Ferredoxin--NADP(+) reductase, partial [uncultured Rubellimicrobium sp.]